MKQMHTLKSVLAIVALLFSFNAMAQFDDMPPQPSEYGKCYAKCKIPDVYEDVSVQVLVKEASSKTVTSPARYETVEERILVKAESVKLVPVPAQYETVTEQVLVKEASTKVVKKDPKYKTVSERVLVADASGRWVKKKRAPECFSDNPDDCYIMCWEEVPAKYKTVTKKVLVSGGDSDVIEIPAEYKTVTKKVVSVPATVKEVVIPAEYKTITKRVLASPASTETVSIPAEYKTVSDRRLVRAGGFTRWVEIVCASDMNSDLIRRVQRALNDRGYDAGPVDGILGTRTKSALQSYQEKSGLPVGNLNRETVESLGLSY